MTQSEIAARARVPRTYILRIEHSHLMPGLLVVRRLAEALQVGVLDLFAAHGEPARESVAAGGNEYWNAFVSYYRELRPDQQADVLAEMRGMLRQRLLQQRLSEYQSVACRTGFERPFRANATV